MTKRHPSTRAIDSAVDSAFFVVGGAAAVWFAGQLARGSVVLGWGELWFVVVFWLLLAYLVLPRLHRILTAVYVPDYFIGRARTSDGLLGDPVNLAFLGSEAQIHKTMDAAAWTRADDLSFASGWRIVRATLSRKSYLRAPVSPLLLFGRQQDFAYQQEVDGSPGRRHHVRFWRCAPGWLLPGGHPADWLAAGTYDRSVGLSLFTLQITHKIDEQTDVERDHIVASVSGAIDGVTVTAIRDFSTGYHARNGGGDAIVTDGDLPVVDVTRVRVGAGERWPGGTDSRDNRPAPIVVGSVFVAARGLAALSLAALGLAGWDSALDEIATGDAAGVARDTAALVVGSSLAGFALLGVVDLWIAWRIYVGANWARLLAMGLSTVSVAGQALYGLVADVRIDLGRNLVGLSLDVLLILALSSQRARLFARRRAAVRRRRPERGTSAAPLA